MVEAWKSSDLTDLVYWASNQQVNDGNFSIRLKWSRLKGVTGWMGDPSRNEDGWPACAWPAGWETAGMGGGYRSLWIKSLCIILSPTLLTFTAVTVDSYCRPFNQIFIMVPAHGHVPHSKVRLSFQGKHLWWIHIIQ